MKVLHLATTYPLYPGDSNAVFVEELAEALAERGHRVDVLVPWHPELKTERPERRANLHAFRYTPSRRWHPWGYAQALSADRALRWDAYLAAPIAAATCARRLRYLAKTAAADVVHAHWMLPNAPIAAAALRGRAQPLVISCHGSGVFLAERHGWGAAAARWAVARCAAITACSHDLKRRAEVVVGRPVEQIPYGVDTRRFSPMNPEERQTARDGIGQRHGLPPEEPWILAVGRLVHKKGFDRLVAALPKVRDRVSTARLLIVGDGPLDVALREQSAALGVGDRVHLLGAVSHQLLPAYYVAADVVAVPSVHGPAGNVDGLPNTFLEALSSGAAVVASRVAGIPDVARDGDNASLVPEGDVESLAFALAGLLQEPARQRQLGAAARAAAEQNLGWARVAARFESLYENVLRT